MFIPIAGVAAGVLLALALALARWKLRDRRARAHRVADVAAWHELLDRQARRATPRLADADLQADFEAGLEVQR